MRKPAMRLGIGNQDAVANGAASAPGVVTRPALGADWFLAGASLQR